MFFNVTSDPKFLLAAAGMILAAALFQGVRSTIKRVARRRSWPASKARQSGMNDREAMDHMRRIAREYDTGRRSRSQVIRGVHWSAHLSLLNIRYRLSHVPADIIAMIPASLWLFDNYYLLYRELKKFQETGGERRFKALPVILSGSARGFPRVYALAHEMISSCGMHLNEDLLFRILMACQESRKLTIAELWAFQNVLCLCLLEVVIREAGKIIKIIVTKRKAEEAVRKSMPLLTKIGQKAPALLKNIIPAELAGDNVFLAHLILRFRSLSIDDSDIDAWIQMLSQPESETAGSRLADIVSSEGQFEAETEARISTLITSLKSIGDLNWEMMFRRVSAVDAILSEDPAGIYQDMDSETKARYRAVIEKLSIRFRISETAAAREVLREASADWGDTRRGNNNAGSQDAAKVHVGEILIGKKYFGLLDRLSSSHSGTNTKRCRAFLGILRKLLYFLSMVALTGGITTGAALLLLRAPGMNPASLALLLAFTLMPAADIAVSLCNFFFTNLVKPKSLPAMDFTSGIPDSCRTFIVMPVIVKNPGQIRNYAGKLEKHYLANRQENLYFAILADYHDASSEKASGDDEILSAGKQAVEALNDKYHSPVPRFYLFFRPRKWNPAENCWMGWERKRGKLESFNAMLCGEKDSGVDLVVGIDEVFPSIRYIITLDADTELLRDGAAQLAGVMAHPLNKPVYDSQKNRITEGYAIVQSAIRTRILPRSAGVFARFFSGQAGIDPYAVRVSDIYQDLFDEGIYAGKGIYDLQAFHQFLHGAIPENAVLSHDLLEGSLSRCAFANNIKLMDGCPASVAAFAKREHRWIRGDWQLLPWIISGSGINGLSRWKMIDNLRRSLVRPALVSLALAIVLAVPAYYWLWLFFAFFDMAFRIIVLASSAVWSKLQNPAARFVKIILAGQAGTIVAQSLISAILLPYRAYLAVDAVLKTLYRLLISRRNLLEWQTAESVERSLQNTPSFYWRLMWMAALPAAAMAAGAVRVSQYPAAYAAWMAIALLWLLSPWIASLTSTGNEPLKHENPDFDIGDMDELRLTARRTWRYFTDYSAIENHWLCPDNVQIHPGLKISNKTSPTNIGLQLMAALSARDLGFTGLIDLVDRSEKVIETIHSLPKWQGHLYNWYNIRTLQVLPPRYVSTVDSGNFCAHLIALKQGLLELQDHAVITPACIRGMIETCRLAGWPREELPAGFETVSDWAGFLQSVDRDMPPAESIDMEWLFIAQESCEIFFRDIRNLKPDENLAEQKTIRQMAESGQEQAVRLIKRITVLAAAIDDMVEDMDFRVLYDPAYQLFSIGFNMAARTLDAGHYDLLVSESRVTSFLAIAKGNAPQKHWFALGRPLTLVKGIPACVSWSGSMFEYMMPNLVMNSPRGSVLQQSCKAAALQHIIYGKKNGIPWGISESQYYRFDTDSNYQYGPFGVQQLRLQASLKPTRVVAPYATLLALPVVPKRALKNLAALRKMGAEGKYGFYEALDFNLPDPIHFRPFSLVSSFMAHHQGMCLAAIDNFLNQDILRHRFHREPMVQATESLLEEKRSGGVVTLASRGYAININAAEYAEEPAESRVCSQTCRTPPLVHVLSNSHYLLMLTSDGAGFSRCDGQQVNRWQPDTVRGENGIFIYLRSLPSGRKWSAAYLPSCVEPDEYQAVFSLDRAEFTRRDGSVRTQTHVTVSPVKNLEVRRVVLTNEGSMPEIIELTSYMEVVADDYMADTLHPAFSKLFIETEYIEDRSLLIARRRSRSPDDKPRFVMHAVYAETKLQKPIEYETGRREFIGRGHSPDSPAIIGHGAPMTCRDGFSKDTILSLRAVVSLPPGKSAAVSFVTGFFNSREEVMRTSHDLGSSFSVLDIFKLALSSSKLELKYLKINAQQLIAIQNLLGCLYYPNVACREKLGSISRLKLGQSALWRFGISGDYPVILLQAGQMSELPIIQDVLLAYEYLRIKLVMVDLVILNEEAAGYAQPLNQKILEMMGNLKIFSQSRQKPGLFLLQKALMNDDEINLLTAVSRLILNGRTGLYAPIALPAAYASSGCRPALPPDIIPLPAGSNSQMNGRDSTDFDVTKLEFFNGIGGFAENGQVYEIHLGNGARPPNPWINVIANDQFGFLVSETGAGYTWSGNSRENKLTEWSNDPVLDPVTEAVYVRDDEDGGVTSPAALTCAAPGGYRIRHGFGYSVFDNRELGLDQSMTIFVPLEDFVKIYHIKLANLIQKPRKLTITFYVEWVLGVVRVQTAPFVETAFHPETGLLTAVNRYHETYRHQIAYIFSSEPVVSYSGNRQPFFRAGGSIRYPAGLALEKCDGETGPGLDPCGIIQIKVLMEPGETREFMFGIGQAGSHDQAILMSDKYRPCRAAIDELARVRQDWQKKLGAVTVHTGDRALDILTNGWLLYQTIACRLRARTAFYQCGGAMGFRDQLQDVLALLDTDTELAKQQIVTCCSRQFIEGDVQHWWFPDTGLGIRTRFSDDYLWLPFVTAEYVRYTGRPDILHIDVSYIAGNELSEDQSEMLIMPQVSDQSDSVYHHCLAAIQLASKRGIHGLPLMKGGDWNDGMNRVGIKGKGESVWLGWFLYKVLQDFIPIARSEGDLSASRQMADLSNDLLTNLEHHAWDGEWYLRAFYDDGQPLGSRNCDECRIDSISQSWAVLSGGAGRVRALTALDSARRLLVREEDSLSLLLTPPFDKTVHDPGYIKGYFPGIRENGGQYTHAAIWLAMAFAEAGKGYDAGQLLTMLNPVRATMSLMSASKYENEPYVMSADISMHGQYAGKAGWSWYTGSSGWMYQAILHTFLGIDRQGDILSIKPAVPAAMRRYVVEYRYGRSLYEITVLNSQTADSRNPKLQIDGKAAEGDSFKLTDDGAVHNVVFRARSK